MEINWTLWAMTLIVELSQGLSFTAGAVLALLITYIIINHFGKNKKEKANEIKTREEH